ncbi:endoplasmic reticulum-based factor for assembly of V-ATPase-domain-containing protein [Xylariales sp. AK1849]|nr:endoplasmic reticulum-based factor for assembly of V-ATPase-domain-containing protein [Xylariales sp. AK1849]
MVLLTMTTSVVEALKRLDRPFIEDATVGEPISHRQVVDLWKQLKEEGYKECTLEGLLRGATVYISPPPPKPEPSEDYKALMARLRREEEQRSYERMVRPRETFAQRFPMAPTSMSTAESFAEANKPYRKSDMGDDSIDHGEVQKQMTLIVNFLVSIAGCAAAIWIAAQWWSTTARLFLTLGGSIVVAVAEVAVYSAYSWRMAEGDKQQQNMKEVKKIVQTWVIGQDDDIAHMMIQPKGQDTDPSLRRRTAAPT